VRYAEIDGVQYEIKENNDLYGVIASDDMLVQIVEVDYSATLSADESKTESVITSYYLVDASSSEYEKLPMGNYMKNVEGRELRTPDEKLDEVGLRFKAQITTASKAAEKYTVTEYGYIIGLEKTLNEKGEQLNFNASNYVFGKAYVRGEYDKVFDSSNDDYHVFTGVLYGIPKDKYAMNVVAKTYTKVTIGENNYVVYGEPMVANLFSIAKALKAQGGLTEDVKTVVDDIIYEATGPDIGFDWGEL